MFVVLNILFFYHDLKHTEGSPNIYKANKKILILTTCINKNTCSERASHRELVRQSIKEELLMTAP